MPLSWVTYFCTHTKRDSCSLCSLRKRNSQYLILTSHIDTSMTYCQLIIKILRTISVRCIPMSLRSKTRRMATLLFSTLVYSIQSGGTISCAIPITTNVTISTSIAQNFHSSITIVYPRQPMAFYLTASYNIYLSVPLMNILF